MKKLTPYQKIMRAMKSGAMTLRLTRDDIITLSMDTAIVDRAKNDDEADQIVADESEER